MPDEPISDEGISEDGPIEQEQDGQSDGAMQPDVMDDISLPSESDFVDHSLDLLDSPDESVVNTEVARQEEEVQVPLPNEQTSAKVDEQQSASSIDPRNLQVDTKTIFNIGSYNESDKTQEENTVDFTVVSEQHWRRILSLFVAPDGFWQAVEQIKSFPEKRLLFVYGQAHTGRFTCAIQLGIQLFNNSDDLSTGNAEAEFSLDLVPKFKIVKSRTRGKRTLVDLLRNKAFQKQSGDTVFILRDMSGSGIALDDLSSTVTIQEVNQRLEDLNAYLILTLTEPERPTIISPLELSAELASEHLPSVLERHLNRYATLGAESILLNSKLVDLVRSLVSERSLLSKLTSPVLINMFCAKLGTLRKYDDGEIDGLAVEVSGSEFAETPRSWFMRLRPNEQLYAMLIVLFEGVDHTFLYDIYSLSVEFFRRTGVSNLKDVREFGIYEMHERLHAFQSEDLSIAFVHPWFWAEASFQVWNHLALLWSLVDSVLLKMIGENRGPEHWQFRMIIARAIARLGRHRLPQLRVVLETLARNSSGAVASAAGNITAELLRGASWSSEGQTTTEYHEYVMGTFREWVKSNDPALKWAFAAAFWRVYDVLVAQAADVNSRSANIKTSQTLQSLDDLFTELASRFDEISEDYANRVDRQFTKQRPNSRRHEIVDDLIRLNLEIAYAIRHAVLMLARNNAKRTCDILARWLQSTSKGKLQALGIMCVVGIFQLESESDEIIAEERLLDVLPLLGPALSATHQLEGGIEPLREMFACLRKWYLFKKHRLQTAAALLYVSNRATTAEREVWLSALATFWLDDENADIRSIAQILLSRCTVLNGSPTSVHGLGHIKVVADCSRRARGNLAALKASRTVYRRLQPYADVEMYAAGRRDPLFSEREWTQKVEVYLSRVHNLPRLVWPAAYDPDPSNTALIVVLSWGDLIDEDDLKGTSIHEKLVEIRTPSPNSPMLDLLYPVPQGWWAKAPILNELVEHLEPYIARHLASQHVERLEEAVRSLGMIVGSEVDLRELDTKLEVSVEQLDRISLSLEDTEKSRGLSLTLLWLLQKHPEHAVSLLSNWITQGTDSDAADLSWRGDVSLLSMTAVGCIKMLFTVLSYQEPVPCEERFGVILGLLAPLGQYFIKTDDAEPLRAALRAIEKWHRDPAWQARIEQGIVLDPGAESGVNGPLALLVDDTLSQALGFWSETVEHWKADLADAEAETTDWEVFVQAIESRILRQGASAFAQLPSEGDFGLILVDAGYMSPQLRREFNAVAADVLNRLSRSRSKDPEFSDLNVFIHRMGEIQPKAQSGETVDANQLMPASQFELPPLAAPIFQQYPLGRIGFVLILAAKRPVDLDDWYGGLKERCRFFFPIASSHQLPDWMRILPPTTVFYRSDKNNIVEELGELRKTQRKD